MNLDKCADLDKLSKEERLQLRSLITLPVSSLINLREEAIKAKNEDGLHFVNLAISLQNAAHKLTDECP